MDGRPLEPQHGFPLRGSDPRQFGMAHVKWLSAITASPEPFTGYQQTIAYRYSESRGDPEPVTLMRVRSLLVPPGIGLLTNSRRDGARWAHGPRAVGMPEENRVEVSTDGGRTWADADLVSPSQPNLMHGKVGATCGTPIFRRLRTRMPRDGRSGRRQPSRSGRPVA
jgi:DMSO/TMAO reductase YedYZ molybdopterin-dependent catalytic subunit